MIVPKESWRHIQPKNVRENDSKIIISLLFLLRTYLARIITGTVRNAQHTNPPSWKKSSSRQRVEKPSPSPLGPGNITDRISETKPTCSAPFPFPLPPVNSDSIETESAEIQKSSIGCRQIIVKLSFRKGKEKEKNVSRILLLFLLFSPWSLLLSLTYLLIDLFIYYMYIWRDSCYTLSKLISVKLNHFPMNTMTGRPNLSIPLW